MSRTGAVKRAEQLGEGGLLRDECAWHSAGVDSCDGNVEPGDGGRVDRLLKGRERGHVREGGRDIALPAVTVEREGQRGGMEKGTRAMAEKLNMAKEAAEEVSQWRGKPAQDAGAGEAYVM